MTQVLSNAMQYNPNWQYLEVHQNVPLLYRRADQRRALVVPWPLEGRDNQILAAKKYSQEVQP
jgi:hypothetical protein